MSQSPAFQFYPGDWLRNSNLRRCSHAARGAWVDVLCLMHDAEEYGVLRWPLADIAQASGVPIDLLQELAAKGVLKGGDSGCEAFVYRPRHAGKEGDPVELIAGTTSPCWYSSRFVRDEHVRLNRGKSTQFTPDNQPEKTPTRKPTRKPKVGIGEREGDGASTALASASASAISPALAGQDQKTFAEPGGPAPKVDTELQQACRATWQAYSLAYLNRYGTEPVRNAKVNSQIKQFVQAIGMTEAPQVARYYVALNDQFLIKQCHPTDLMLKQASAYRTQWATNTQMTSTKAKQVDRSQTNAGNVHEAAALAIQMRRDRENGNAN